MNNTPHPLSNIEWWYFFAFLKKQGETKNSFAIMGSFFRVGEFPLPKGHYLIFSLIDLNKKNYQSYSFLDRKLVNQFLLYLPYYLLKYPSSHPMRKLFQILKSGLPFPHRWLPQVRIDTNPTSLHYGNQTLSFFGEGEANFNLYFNADEDVINLQFTPQKPITLIGGNGKPDRLHYYSYTNNHVNGTLRKRTSSEKITVTGQGWFDHQWGKTTLEEMGWDWFGIQLEDGRELLINRYHSMKTGLPMVNLIDRDGSITFTRNVRFQTEGYTWKSLRTNARYPLKWKILIPAQKDFNQMEITVKPIFNHQEMCILGPIQGIWEGACSFTVKETLSNQKVKTTHGFGFMELVGYANPSYSPK